MQTQKHVVRVFSGNVHLRFPPARTNSDVSKPVGTAGMMCTRSLIIQIFRRCT